MIAAAILAYAVTRGVVRGLLPEEDPVEIVIRTAESLGYVAREVTDENEQLRIIRRYAVWMPDLADA